MQNYNTPDRREILATYGYFSTFTLRRNWRKRIYKVKYLIDETKTKYLFGTNGEGIFLNN